SRRTRGARRDAGAVRRASRAGESHAQAVADRSAAVQWYRERLLGRIAASCSAVAIEADVEALRRGSVEVVRRDAVYADRLDEPHARRARRWLPGEGDCVSGRHGRAWPVS